MIEALRIADIVRKYNTPKVYKARVSYHAKKLNIQNIIVPITKKYEKQSDEVNLYLLGYKIIKDEIQVNPVTLKKVETADEADVYFTYWNRLHFYKLPRGMKLAKADAPF